MCVLNSSAHVDRTTIQIGCHKHIIHSNSSLCCMHFFPPSLSLLIGNSELMSVCMHVHDTAGSKRFVWRFCANAIHCQFTWKQISQRRRRRWEKKANENWNWPKMIEWIYIWTETTFFQLIHIYSITQATCHFYMLVAKRWKTFLILK